MENLLIFWLKLVRIAYSRDLQQPSNKVD